MNQIDRSEGHSGESYVAGPLTWSAVIALVLILLIGVDLIGDGFKWISGGTEGAERIFAFASNPLFGVMLGTLATALVQSSSTVTSVIVGLVAGGVPVEFAIPMIMGANMGTTITNTIVSLGNLHDGPAFRKSFQAATVHDFFNLYTMIIFLPVEWLFHPLEQAAGAMAGWFVGSGDASIKDLNFLAAVTDPVASLVVGVFKLLPHLIGASLTILVGLAMVVVSVLLLGKLLRTVMTGKAQGFVDQAIGRGPVRGVLSGAVVTIVVQSSSTTTSLVVPLAGAGVLTTRQVYPFTLGANIGTCFTALLAATAVGGDYKIFALQIAFVHLLYNVFGVILFMTVPFLRELPIKSAEWLGKKSEIHRGWAFGYILAMFFVLPGCVFASDVMFWSPQKEITAAIEDEQALADAEEEILKDELIIE